MERLLLTRSGGRPWAYLRPRYYSTNGANHHPMTLIHRLRRRPLLSAAAAQDLLGIRLLPSDTFCPISRHVVSIRRRCFDNAGSSNEFLSSPGGVEAKGADMSGASISREEKERAEENEEDKTEYDDGELRPRLLFSFRETNNEGRSYSSTTNSVVGGNVDDLKESVSRGGSQETMSPLSLLPGTSTTMATTNDDAHGDKRNHRDGYGGRNHDPGSDTLSPESVWRGLTRKILEQQHLRPVWDDGDRHQAEMALRWWARQRPLTREAAEMTWKLWHAMLWSLKAPESRNGREFSPDENRSGVNLTNLLNVVLDHWRLSVKESVPVPYNPTQVLDELQRASDDERVAPPLVVPDTRSYTLLLGAMADWKPVPDPWAAEQVLFDNMLTSPRTEQRPNRVTWNTLLTVWAKSGWPRAAERAQELLLEIMPSHGVEPNHISYSCVLEAWASCAASDPRAPEQAQALLEEMKHQEHEQQEQQQRDDDFFPVCYLHVLQAWSRSPCEDGADRANALLQSLLQQQQQTEQQGASASSWIKTMKHCFSAVMAGYARRGRADRVEGLLRTMQDLYEQTGGRDPRFLPTAAVFNSVLEAYAATRSPEAAERAQRLLERMWEAAEGTGSQACRPDATSVNTVVHAWAESGDPHAVERAEALLADMQDRYCVAPDSYTYTTVMKAWARSDRPDAAERCEAFLQAMWEADQASARPNHVTYGAVLYAWSRSSDPDAPFRAEAVYRHMMEGFKNGDADLKPTEATYVALITVWNRNRRQGGHRHHAEQRQQAAARAQFYFDQARGRYMAGDDTLRPTAKLYNALLESRRVVGDGPGAERILSQMIDDYRTGTNERARPDSRSFNTALSSWAQSRDHSAPFRAEALLMRMQELHEKGEEGWEGCRPNRFRFTTVLECWARSVRPEAPERAEAILRHMERLYRVTGDTAIRPDNNSYATVLKAWARSGSEDAPERAQALFDEILERHQRQRAATGSDGNSDGEKLKPSSTVYASLLKTWARSSSRRSDAPLRALALLNEMEDRHLRDPDTNERPDCLHFSAVISAFAERGDSDNAEALLRRITDGEGGVRPNSGCFNGLAKAHARSGRPNAADRAEEVLHWMARQGGAFASPDVFTYTTCLGAWQQAALARRPDAVDGAERILEQMLDQASSSVENNGRPLVLNASPFLAFLRVLSAAPPPDDPTKQDRDGDRKSQRAEEIIVLMKQLGVRPTRAVFLEVERCRRRRSVTTNSGKR